MVAPGVISTAAPEFAFTLMPDGREVYFTHASADRTVLTVMTASRRATGEWTTPVVASFSGAARDVDPFVTPDGRRLYFSSDRARASHPAGVYSTWYVERRGEGWSAPIDPGAPLNSAADDVFVSATRDGLVIFTSSRDGTRRLYQARETRDRWSTPTPLRLGARDDAANPALAPSGRLLIVTLPAAGGAPDLFVSCRQGDAWAEPRPLTAINSAFADFAPFVDADEQFLYFTSERPGVVAATPGARPPGDIYRVPLVQAGARCP